MKNLIKFTTSALLALFFGLAISTVIGTPLLITSVGIAVLGQIATSALPIGALGTIVQNPLIGRSRNKLGNTVFSKWKGLNILKSKPDQVSNPDTVSQQKQRSIWVSLNLIGRSLINTIRLGFPEVSTNSTEWASFFKYNSKTAYSKTTNPATFEADDMTMSRGTLVNPSDLSIDSITSGDIDITWTDNTGAAGANASDVLVFAMVNTAGDDSYGLVTSVARTVGSASFTVPFTGSINDYSMYLFFANTSLKSASDSILAQAHA